MDIWIGAGIFALAVALGFGLRALRIARVVPLFFLFTIGMGAGYLTRAHSTPLWWGYVLGIVLVGISAGFFVGLYWHSRKIKGAFAAKLQYIFDRTYKDFRVSAVFIGLLLAVCLTFYFARLAADETAKFWTEFYAAWTSGLLFFTVVGLILGLVALYRPERDVFAARVKILTGGKEGSAVDYLASELRRIGFVGQQTTREITIGEYDDKCKAFKVSVKLTTIIANIYDDVPTGASGSVKITPDNFEDDQKVLGEFTAFRLNGTVQPGVPFEYGTEGMTRNWSLEIPGGGTGKLEYEYWGWYKDTETHDFVPVRFTQELKVKFRCRCRPPTHKRLVLKLTTPQQTEEHMLGWDSEFDMIPLKDLEPAKLAYTFRLGFEA